jgi:threonylcarbamoyladenosine tRNA methylthiotransferase MtaB
LGVDLVVSNQDKDRLVEIAREQLSLPVMPEAASAPDAAAIFAHGRQRAFIKVQDGCRYRCTFCIVTVARGEERSRPVAEIVDEINTLVAQGVQEAALTGVHVGGYGSDLADGCDLYTLIKTILAETDLPRLRLASVEPWDLPENFFELFANPRLMPHMHLPLQSGADSVLRRMARRCKTGEFRELIAQARAVVPDFNVTSDIIVGFPGETEDEWQQTLDYVREIGFGHLHIFSYSPRAGTKAARLPGAVEKAVKQARSRELHALAAQMKRDTLARFVDREFEVLWEGDCEQQENGRWKISGYTPNYLRVIAEVDDGPARNNTLDTVRSYAVDESGNALLVR